jgi:hypothetical protein
MEQLGAELPEEQQAGLEQSLASLQQQQTVVQSLAETRAKFGSASVDLVLSKEAELMKAHQQLLALYRPKP